MAETPDMQARLQGRARAYGKMLWVLRDVEQFGSPLMPLYDGRLEAGKWANERAATIERRRQAEAADRLCLPAELYGELLATAVRYGWIDKHGLTERGKRELG